MQALAGVCAFTGNDYSPSFYRKDKNRPFAVINKHEKFVNAFMFLGDLSLTNEIINTIDEFTCHLYGCTKLTNINEVIKIHFENKTKPKPSQKPLNFIKGIEPTALPPGKDVLIQHIKQSWLIAKLNKMALQPFPLEGLTPIYYGWTLSINFLTVKWFDGEQVPDRIDKIEYRDDSDAEDSETDDSDEESESDSEI